jgi:lipopolysaccharide transport system permease protein
MSSMSSTAHVEIQLPEKPLVTIEPASAWRLPDLREVWTHRELLYFLTLRDLKVRYKQTALGVGWVVMQPLMMTLIFTVFLGKLARVPSDGAPYPIFVFAGMLPWLFVSGSITATGNSLVGSSNLITKVYFPRVIIPTAIIGGRLFDFLVSAVIFIGLMVYYQIPITTHLLMVPLTVVLMIMLALAIGLWASAVNVKYRDVAAALPVLVQVWMFSSPVVYPSSLVLSQNISRPLRWFYVLNPMVGIIDNFRAAVLGTAFNWPALSAALIITVALFCYGAYEFRRLESMFADLI